MAKKQLFLFFSIGFGVGKKMKVLFARWLFGMKHN
jgi:hypothetical protein